MKIKDLAEQLNINSKTILRAIQNAMTNRDNTKTFVIAGTEYIASKKTKKQNSPWIISTDKDGVIETDAAEIKSSSFLLKQEQAKLQKLELEIKKLDENLISTKEKIRREIIEEAKEAVQDALLVIHNVYLNEFKPDKESKERLDKALQTGIGNVRNIR